MNYLVAAVGDWNKQAFEDIKPKLKGNWAYVASPEELEDKLQEGFAPRYIFFPHWRWIVPAEIFNPYECICFHMTDVPYGRGGSPLQNLIVRGHKNTVLTALQMEEGLDSGPVYLKKPLSLEGSAETIYNRASKLTWQMISDIIETDIKPQPQEGTVVEFKRRTPDQSKIPDSLNLEQLYDYIRMLDAPGYPKAFLETDSYYLEFENSEQLGNEVIANVKIKLKEL